MIRVRLRYPNGEVHFHDAVACRLEGETLVVQTVEQRTLRLPVGALDEWAVRRPDGAWAEVGEAARPRAAARRR